MVDVFSKHKRSEIMSRIRSKNTGIEKTVFSYLRKRNIYFYKHYAKVAGKPDISLPSKKLAVFIDGDFWHGYRFPIWEDRIPKIYWKDKIASNRSRDKKRFASLRRQGWRVLRIWGHEIIERPDYACAKIATFLRKGR